jgi:predicted DNA-binding protein (UPF0251 family)
MPRPRKRRKLSRQPEARIYKPAGLPLEALPEVQLLQEELEALRLCDLEGLNQTQAAANMNVSRSTLQRILAHARRQVALALVESRALVISGGDFEVSPALRHRPNR